MLARIQIPIYSVWTGKVANIGLAKYIEISAV
jgi:hypothetical protein